MKFSLCVVTLSVVTALATPISAQILRLGVEGHPRGEALEARVGDIIGVQIIADFQSQRATGLAAYLSLPEDLFQVQDLGLSGQQGTQPFRKEPLFAGAHLQINRLLPESDDVAAAVPGQQLDLAALFGLDSVGETDGKGVVATFEVLVLGAADRAVLRIDDSPIRETKMVLSDGRSERHFQRTEDLEISIIDPIASQVGAWGWGLVKGRHPSGS